MESVDWADEEDRSVVVIGGKAVPIILCVEWWPYRPEEWSAGAWVGVGPQAVCIYSSGRKVKGHPSRDEAKVEAVAGLRAWLAGVQAGLDGRH